MDNHVREREYSFTVLYEPAEEGGYVVTCPALPGLVTEGETLEEAVANVREAIELYLETLPQEERDRHLSREILTTTVEVNA